MYQLGKASFEKRADGVELLGLKTGGKIIKLSFSQSDPLHAFLSDAVSDSHENDVDVKAARQWAVEFSPLPFGRYPEVSPVDFRFPLYENVGHGITWVDQDYPFVTFISGREGSHKTSFLASINYTTQYLNRTNIINIKHDGSTVQMMYRIKDVFLKTRQMYRSNRDSFKNPFKRVNTIILIDDVPSEEFATSELEDFYATLYDSLDDTGESYAEYVKVFITSKNRLNPVFAQAAHGSYATMTELVSTHRISKAAAEIYGDGEIISSADSKDALGWNTWRLEMVRGSIVTDQIIKTPQVSSKYVIDFLDSDTDTSKLDELSD